MKAEESSDLRKDLARKAQTLTIAIEHIAALQARLGRAMEVVEASRPIASRWISDMHVDNFEADDLDKLGDALERLDREVGP